VRKAFENKLRSDSGYSLLELIITLGVLSILIMGTIPLAQNSAKRQKEMKLRETLRMVRTAIDEFKRDTFGACTGASTTANQTLPGPAAPVDPRSRVVIDDCKIFDSENVDRYPPDLEVLLNGVRVKPRSPNLQSGSGIRDGETQATEINEQKEIIKVYLRELPVDPMTGEKDWKFRSSYQSADSDSWDDINVFDIRSASDEEALNGENYSDW
jgi:general secretion pathway protein G